LNNVLKHSHATEVVLSAQADDYQAEISLRDNGAGFDPAKVDPNSEKNGLVNMRQRIESIGGRFAVESSPGKGTLIRLTVNFPRVATAGGKPHA
jgi:signal transduction histidine kinase